MQPQHHVVLQQVGDGPNRDGSDLRLHSSTVVVCLRAKACHSPAIATNTMRYLLAFHHGSTIAAEVADAGYEKHPLFVARPLEKRLYPAEICGLKTVT